MESSTPTNLAHKTVLVTGGANGIGAAIVQAYASLDANIVVADLPSASASARSLIDSLGHAGRAIFVPVDITDWMSMVGLFKAAVSEFGKVDVVVANAGIMETRPFFDFDVDASTGELREESGLARVVDVNLKGTMNSKCCSFCAMIRGLFWEGLCDCCSWGDFKSNSSLTTQTHTALRLAMFHMQSNQLQQFPSLNSPMSPSRSDVSPAPTRGSIVLISSTSGFFGGTSVVSYIASKHGVIGLLRASQAAARKFDVQVNAVAPFITPTFITEGYSEKYRQRGLPLNTPTSVADVVVRTSLGGKDGRTESPGGSGNCFLVCDPFSSFHGLLLIVIAC